VRKRVSSRFGCEGKPKRAFSNFYRDLAPRFHVSFDTWARAGIELTQIESKNCRIIAARRRNEEYASGLEIGFAISGRIYSQTKMERAGRLGRLIG